MQNTSATATLDPWALDTTRKSSPAALLILAVPESGAAAPAGSGRGVLPDLRGDLSSARGDLSVARGDLSDTLGDLSERRPDLSDRRRDLSDWCGGLSIALSAQFKSVHVSKQVSSLQSTLYRLKRHEAVKSVTWRYRNLNVFIYYLFTNFLRLKLNVVFREITTIW